MYIFGYLLYSYKVTYIIFKRKFIHNSFPYVPKHFSKHKKIITNCVSLHFSTYFIKTLLEKLK